MAGRAPWRRRVVGFYKKFSPMTWGGVVLASTVGLYLQGGPALSYK